MLDHKTLAKWGTRIGVALIGASFVTAAGFAVYGWRSFAAYQRTHANELAAARADTASTAQSALYDLAAQQQMAEWAYSLLAVSVIGLAVSVGGVVVVALTLRETRRMTLATREIGEDQTRAYVLTDNFIATRIYRSDKSTFQIAPHFDIRNVGHTPAFNVRQNTRFAWMTDDEAAAFVPNQKLDVDGILGPGLQRQSGAVLGEYDRSDLTDGYLSGKRLWVKGVIHFEDAMGVRWEHRFCWYLKDTMRLTDSEDVDEPDGRATDFNMTAFTAGNTLRRLANDEV